MDAFLVLYIASRMKEMGHCHYTTPQPVRIRENKIIATNDFYYLTAKSITSPTLIIRADYTNFNQGAAYNNFNLNGIQEFSGIITLDESNIIGFPLDYEFVKVTVLQKLEEDQQKVVQEYRKLLSEISN
ncbi:MAG: hypothetical protein Q7W13_13055 [Bacteroidia bacterium]|nr:hypothetical protein [Bacteroidia bacterium]